jgi:hypothetical protein
MYIKFILKFLVYCLYKYKYFNNLMLSPHTSILLQTFSYCNFISFEIYSNIESKVIS